MPFEHPIDESTGRYRCSPEYPMPADCPPNSRWVHTNVEEVGDQVDGYPGGDMQCMRCMDCGETWWTELPQ